MKRDDLVAYLDRYLRTHDIKDASWNGVQVEGPASVEEVTHVASAVDPTLEAIDGAAKAGAQVLLVHHGYFWGRGMRIAGPLREKVRRLIDSDLTLYVSHLPLDAHPEVGNNARLAALLELEPTGTFARMDGTDIGVVCETPKTLSRKELAGRLARGLKIEPIVHPLGPARLRRIGIVTGSGSSSVSDAIGKRLDCLVTGEWSYSHYQNARDHGLNVVCGGHYATETLGVRALGEHLAESFGLRHTFVSDPAPM